MYDSVSPCTEPHWFLAVKLPDLHIVLRLRHHFDHIPMPYSQNITPFQNQHYVQLCTCLSNANAEYYKKPRPASSTWQHGGNIL